MIRLLIVEDQAMVSKGIRMILAGEPDLVVSGETCDGEEALAMAASLCPDVILIDADGPLIDEMKLSNRLHTLCPKTAIIFLTMRDDAATCKRAASVGAATLVGKTMPANWLLSKIRQYGSVYTL